MHILVFHVKHHSSEYNYWKLKQDN